MNKAKQNNKLLLFNAKHFNALNMTATHNLSSATTMYKSNYCTQLKICILKHDNIVNSAIYTTTTKALNNSRNKFQCSTNVNIIARSRQMICVNFSMKGKINHRL